MERTEPRLRDVKQGKAIEERAAEEIEKCSKVNSCMATGTGPAQS